MKANYSHLCKEQRNNIENLITKGFNFTYIGKSIGVDRTTVAKEIKRNRYVKHYAFSQYSMTGINRAIKACDKLSKPPYCCNQCKCKNSCTKAHLYYNAKTAQKHYEDTLIETRSGIDITQEEINIINKDIVPLIKNKKQSVNQVYINHPDILYFSKTTFYKYVNDGVISLTNLDLPKKVKYKKRRKNSSKKNKRDIALLKGRTFEDYTNKINENNKLKQWQLDTVIGKKTDKKCLMTFLLVETNFMIIRLLDKKDVKNVNNAFSELKRSLGTELYSASIDTILTDNGIEFYDPIHLELDLDTGEKLCKVYYCHPNSPEEKPELEKNHVYIRCVLPKKTSFEGLTVKQVKCLEDNINNIPRDILGEETPYKLTNKKYPKLIEKLNSRYISPDDVTLNKKDILGDNHEK